MKSICRFRKKPSLRERLWQFTHRGYHRRTAELLLEKLRVHELTLQGSACWSKDDWTRWAVAMFGEERAVRMGYGVAPRSWSY